MAMIDFEDDYSANPYSDWREQERDLGSGDAGTPEPYAPPSYDPQPVQQQSAQAPDPPQTNNDGGLNSGGSDGSGSSGNSDTPAPKYNTGRADVDTMINRDWGSWERRLQEEAKKAGTTYDASDLQSMIANVSYKQNQGKDPIEFINERIGLYAKKAQADRDSKRQPTIPTSGGRNTGGGGGSNGGGGNQSLNFDQAQFTDPITRIIEEFARMRAQERAQPSAGSGQALLEEALKNISQQFQSGGYTPAEQEIYQTQAMDPLERLRTSRKQQVLQQLSARGIPPTSGVAMQMLADVDRQFDAQRTATHANLAGQFGNERVGRMLQGTQMLGQLAGTQNDRMNEAFQYSTVPMNLADRAFNQSMQVFDRAEGSANNAYGRMAGTYNMSGNPMSMAPALLQLQQLQQNRGDSWQETMGYILALMAQGQR